MKKSTSLFFLFSLFLAGLAWGLLSPNLLSRQETPSTVSLAHPDARPEKIRSELGTFAKLAKELKPAVVNISVVKPVENRRDWPSTAYDLVPEALGQGSGVIISSQGEVITNNHVVSGATTIQVKLSDGRELKARVVGADPATDLALLRLEQVKGDLPVATLGDSDKMEVGDWVMAIGNPFGLEATVTAGVLSGKGRTIGASDYDDFLQTDASINPGNSGGPLFNTQGEVIGINTAIVSGGQGIGFSIPINMAKEVCSALKQDGRVIRGFVGIGIQPVTPAIKSALGLHEGASGALVSTLMPDGPAQRAGLEIGDIISSIDGSPVNSSRQLLNTVARLKVGQASTFTVQRDGELIELKVSIIERPALLNSPAAETAPLPHR